jgi:hypothetical protein
MRDYGLDGGDSSVSTPDLQKNVSSAITSASITSKDSYSITIENLPVKLTGKYNFVFQYSYKNPDASQSTPILGPESATYSIESVIPDLSTAPTNVVGTGGFYSYQLKWDTPTFLSYADTIVYENSSNSFNSSSKVVYVGTANQCTILTSDLIPKYVYVVHRDMFLDANKKGTVAGPITIQDPITVDVNPPVNTFAVGTTTVQDDPDGLFTFNKKILFTWTENADATTYGYQIRFRRLGTTDYTYMTAPGKSTTSTYLYGLKAGQTYQIDITTYDQFGNINTANWRSYPNIVISGSTSLQADVAITAGDMKLGYGIGGDNANKGLYLGPENYWYVVGNTTASSAARLSIGGTSDKMVWNGTSLSITGDLTARAGTFSGNILMSTSNASIYNGTINAAGNLTGNGFALNSTGLKVANGTNSVTIDAANGQIIANAGTIGGWSLTSSLLNQNSARLSSDGYIELGAANTDDIVRLDALHADYRLWIGRNSSATAPFKVSKAGVLTASGATISGTINASGGDFTGYVTGGNVKFGAKVSGTNNGIYIDTNNYWYDTGTLKVGNADKYLKWDGSALSVVGTLTAQNNSAIGDWKVDADGTLGSGLGSGGTYLFANGVSSGSGVTFSVYTGKMVYAAQGFSSMADSPLVFLNSSPQISSLGGVRINNAFVPSADNTYSLGFTGNRWQIVRSAGGVSTTSDARIKKDIYDSELGLNFINALRPVSYKLISGGKVYKDGAEKTVIDNKIVEPEMVDRPGIRTHWGFLAQEVKEAVDACGVEDFAGWQLDDVSDSESGQSLVHHEFLGPIVKAIQELSSRLDALEA